MTPLAWARDRTRRQRVRVNGATLLTATGNNVTGVGNWSDCQGIAWRNGETIVALQ